jgi:sugar/nucleoside kinase (ribokinase family)
MLLSCGDALVDFLPVKSIDGRDAAVPVAGGSCLNIAVGMARLGAPAGFVGGISTDLFGRMVADHALTSGVDLRYAMRSGHQTTLAFVRHVDGEPHYAFYDEATASRNWTYRRGSIPFDEIEAIHVGSTTLANDNGAAQALAMIEDAGGSVTISFDPNCRPNLVRQKARYIAWMSILNFSMAAATKGKGRSRSSLLERAWSSSRAGSRELGRGTGKWVWLRSRRPPPNWWIRSGQATVFKLLCCSPCAPSDGSNAER